MTPTAVGNEHGPAPKQACTCDRARRTNGWCAACGQGFVAGVPIASHTVWEALDAHGHPIEVAGLDCKTCTEAHASGGFCSQHKRGFVDGQAYYSRLTYWLAQGAVVENPAGDCARCGNGKRSSGWCEAHARGLVGNVAFTDRDVYLHAARAMEVLTRALERVPDCELCAAAMAIDGRCPVHKLSFDLGVESPDP